MPYPKIFEEFITTEERKIKCYLRTHYPTVSNTDVDDVFQESALALYSNIRNGKYKKQSGCSLFTYFTTICKNQMNKYLSKNTYTLPLPENYDVFQESNLDYLLNSNSNPYHSFEDKLESMVKNLSDPCKTLLWGFYWENLDMKTLASLLGYASEDTAKTQKSRCLSKFRGQCMNNGFID